MSRYRRILVPGGTYFFTLALADRSSTMLTDDIDRLRTAYAQVQSSLPFTTVAICVLPDHMHAIWTLPANDADYSGRWQKIKAAFSKGRPPAPDRSASKAAKGEKGIWQRRFWEHHIADDLDLERHINYVHFKKAAGLLADGVESRRGGDDGGPR